MRQLPSTEEMINVEDFVAIDSEENTGQLLTDNDTVSRRQGWSDGEYRRRHNDEETKEPIREDITCKEARQCLSTLTTVSIDDSMTT